MITEAIYNMLLRALHVTYTPDEDTAERIRTEGAAGIALIQKYCDPEADCSPGTRCGQLLCEYVLRSEAGAAETFLQDFTQDIVEIKNESDIKAYAEAQGYA
ncbi:MAG: hypothetical protein IJV14_06565 [Lachnospiraceae bacterium]|nr:hypothetical protein [Lachnospiraceae bacterium]